MFEGCCSSVSRQLLHYSHRSPLPVAPLHALTALIAAAVIACDWATPTVPFDTGPDWDLSLSSPEVKGSTDADRHAQTVPRARAGDGEMMPDDKMDADIQSGGGVRRGRVFREEWSEDGSTRSLRAMVIDWIHHQVAILGFNQPSKHHTHAQAIKCMHTHTHIKREVHSRGPRIPFSYVWIRECWCRQCLTAANKWYKIYHILCHIISYYYTCG